MKMIKKFFFNISIKYKLLVAVLINITIMCVFTIVGFSIFSNEYNKLLFNTIAENLAYSSQSITDQLKQIETLSSTITTSSIIQSQLSTISSETYSSNNNFDINASINKELLKLNSLFYSNNYTGVSFITLYSGKLTNCTNWALLHKESSSTIENSLTDGRNSGGGISWNRSSFKNTLLLTRQIRKIENLDLTPIGDLLISVNLDAIVKKSNNIFSKNNDSQYLIINQQGDIIYSSPSLPSNDADFLLANSQKPYQLLTLNNKIYFSTLGSLPDYNYKYINIIPFDKLVKSYKLILFITLVFIFVGAVIIFLFSHYMIRYIINQFNKLILKMRYFGKNELVLYREYENINSKDELIQLHQHFDEMAAKIQRLIKVNYINEILTKDAQLKTLEAQINPHFLYNTLESINWHAKASNDKDISSMVESLGKLLRSTLSNKESLVTLKYELDLVNSYMTIQKIRFESQLLYSLEVDENLMDYSIPPLIIQPLLENAIRYGLEEVIENCNIILQIKLENNLIIINVNNEGSQFEPDLLDKLRKKQLTPNDLGIGLLNIDQRIKILFGSEYGLFLSNQNGFAIATLKIPIENLEETKC